MRTISFCNQKGGVGKTTSAAESAGLLAGRGYRVLAVDMVSQMFDLMISRCLI